MHSWKDGLFVGTPVLYFRPGSHRGTKRDGAGGQPAVVTANEGTGILHLHLHGNARPAVNNVRYADDPWWDEHEKAARIEGAWHYIGCVVPTTNPMAIPLPEPRSLPKPEPKPEASQATVADAVCKMHDEGCSPDDIPHLLGLDQPSANRRAMTVQDVYEILHTHKRLDPALAQ